MTRLRARGDYSRPPLPMRPSMYLAICAVAACAAPLTVSPRARSPLAPPVLATAPPPADDATVRRRALALLTGTLHGTRGAFTPDHRAADEPAFRARWHAVLARDLARLDPVHDPSRVLADQVCVLRAAVATGVPTTCDLDPIALDSLDPSTDPFVRGACVDVLAASLGDPSEARAVRRAFAMHAGDALEIVSLPASSTADLATSFVYRPVASSAWSYRTVRLALAFAADEPVLVDALARAARYRCRRVHGVLEQRAFRPHTHAPIEYAPAVFRADLAPRPELLGASPAIACEDVPRGRTVEPESLALVRASVGDPWRYLAVTAFTDHDWDVVRDAEGVPQRRVRIVSVYVRDEY